MLLYNAGCGFRLQGGAGGVQFLTAAILTGAVLYPVFRIGAFGAGDVKLFGICAGALPDEKILWFLFYSLLMASAFSIGKMIIRGNMRERFSYFAEYVRDVVQTGNLKLYIKNAADCGEYGVCLAGPVLGGMLLYCGGVY